MSLIEDALRRAQESGAKPSGSSRPLPKPSQAAPPDRPSRRSFGLPQRLGISLIAAGFILVAALMSWELWSYLRAAQEPAMPAMANQPRKQSLLRSGPPALELNGVVEGSGEPFAIINGNILRAGEKIEGAMLVEVGKNFARLRWRRREILLQTPR